MGEVSVMVDAGKATAAAPLGPALGPLGVNIGEIVKEINAKTSGFAGMKVPVKITVHANKTFDVSVGMPPTSALIKKELGVETAAANPKAQNVGNLSLDQAKKIATTTYAKLTAKNMKNAVAEIAGTCNSMGVSIEGMHAKEFQKALHAGKFDAQLAA